MRSSSLLQNRIFFMTIKDRIYCLTSSSILLPMSVFIAATTFRNFNIINSPMKRSDDEILEIYIITVRCAFSLTGIITGLLCTFVVVACPQKNLSLVTLLLSILSTFGALITIATTIFSTNWSDKTTSLRKTIFILSAILSFSSALTVSICLLNRFRRPDRSMLMINSMTNDPIEVIEHASCILAALFIISSFTSIIGFSLGYYVSDKMGGIKILGGGSHSGIFGLLSTTLFIIAICIKKKLRIIFLSISLGLGIFALVGSSVSFYTEEIEYYKSIELIETRPVILRKSMSLKLLLLTKHTLVLVTSIFNLVFAAPLTVLICCLLKEDLLISSINNNASYNYNVSNNNHNNNSQSQSPIRMEYNANAYQFCNLRTPLLVNNNNGMHIHNQNFQYEPSPTNFRQKPINYQQNSPQNHNSLGRNSIANIVGANNAGNTNPNSTLQNVTNNNNNEGIIANQTCDLLQQLSKNN